MSIEAMKQALEALLFAYHEDEAHPKTKEAITSLKQAIAEAEKQEPVGYWMGEFSKDGGATLYEAQQESVFGRKYRNIPLYTRPPQRQWVGLTDEEIDQGLVRTNYAMQTAGAWRDGVEWAQSQLKEKNNG
jgi:hypothetical protein